MDRFFRHCLPYGLTLGLLCTLIACGGGDEREGDGATTPPAIRSDRARLESQMREARANLTAFYLRTFGPMIRSGLYDNEQMITRLDHYAHRLLVPDRDWTYKESLDTLAEYVRFKEVDATDADGSVTTRRVAHFEDEVQLHRDQYAAIMSEMGIERLGPATLEEFVAASRFDFGSGLLTRRIDLPWTVALLAERVSSARPWPTAAGKDVSVEGIARQMLATPFFPDERDPFACYDYHSVYALAVGFGRGHGALGEDARRMMSEAFEVAREVCAASRARGDSMEEVGGRIKLNGHLLEAYFRGGPDLFPIEGYRTHVERTVEELLLDSGRLANLTVYQGPPDIFVTVPHAIHGLDLGLAGAPEGRRN